MSILDQLGKISGDVASSTTNSINNILGIQTQGKINFFKPLDVQAGVLFANLPPGNNRSFFEPLDVMASVLFVNLKETLNIKGRSLSTDKNSAKYSIGFTPEVDFITDATNVDEKNSPIERGILLKAGIINKDGTTDYGVLRDTNDILNTDIPNAYTAFDDPSGQEFLHRLDHEKIPISNDGDIYLSSFVQTANGEENEDPISFGYDVIINYANSPLFNGSIDDFITNFSNYDEIGSRLDILEKFKEQFFRFFKVDSPNSVDSIDTSVKVRTYYLKKLIGLDNLSESILPEKSKQFINYGSNEDSLILTLNEDVSVSMGYLTALYKTLTWSKVHGKKMIPDNLLRFDMDIVVTEARKYNRVSKNEDNSIDQYADLISRYRYKIYECQFFFDKMSHGDTIDMWGLDTSQGFDIRINYKFSTVSFEKFTNFDFNNNTITLNYGSTSSIDNSKTNLSSPDPIKSNKFYINDGKIELLPIQYSLNKYSGYAPNNSESSTDVYKNLTGEHNINLYGGDEFTKKLANKHSVQKSTTLILRDKLLEKTLLNISENITSDGFSLRDSLLEKTLDNISQNYKFSLSNLGGLLISKLNGGFTEDGYEYNIAAHYANKLVNTTFDLLGKAVNPTIKDIYQAKVLFQESTLMEINNGINFLSNQLNGAGQKQNIYGDGKSTKLVYSGDNLPIDNPSYTPAHNVGNTFNIYDNTNEEPIPFHHGVGNFGFGPSSVQDIYDRIIEEPIPFTHHKGSAFNIYNNTKEEPDTPPHNNGATFDIYNNTTEEPNTPPHHNGSTFDIYNNTTEEPNTPPHHNGFAFDIYDNNKEYPDFPIEGVESPTFDIYANKKEYPYTPAHNTGKLLSIYGK